MPVCDACCPAGGGGVHHAHTQVPPCVPMQFSGMLVCSTRASNNRTHLGVTALEGLAEILIIEGLILLPVELAGNFGFRGNKEQSHNE